MNENVTLSGKDLFAVWALQLEFSVQGYVAAVTRALVVWFNFHERRDAKNMVVTTAQVRGRYQKQVAHCAMVWQLRLRPRQAAGAFFPLVAQHIARGDGVAR